MSFVLSYPLTLDLAHNHQGKPQGVAGRAGNPLVAICLHELGMTMESYIAYLHSPKHLEDIRPGEHGSVHFAVEVGGALHQFVLDQDTAWGLQGLHNPTWSLTGSYPGIDPDYLFVHIGLESFALNAPAVMFSALAQLVAYIAINNSLTVDAVHVISHTALDDTYPQCADALLTNLIAVAQFYVENGNADVGANIAQMEAELAALQTQVDALEATVNAALGTIATFGSHPGTVAGASTLGHIEIGSTLTVDPTTGLTNTKQLAAAYTVDPASPQTIVPSISAIVQFGVVVSDPNTWATLGGFQHVAIGVNGLYRLRARAQFASADWTVGKTITLSCFKNGTLLAQLALVTLQATLTAEVVEIAGACEFVVSAPTDTYDVRILTNDNTVTSPTKSIAAGSFAVEKIGS